MHHAIVHTPEHIEREYDTAFETMLLKQTASLAAYARRLTGNATDSDDLLQDTLLRCWTARTSFRPSSSMGAWSRTVMRNSFFTDRRRARFQADLPADMFDHLLGVSENQSAYMDLRDVDRAVIELDLDQREAVVLASQGLSIAEAAVHLAINPGTYKSRLARGRERLRELTEERATPLLPDRRLIEIETKKRAIQQKRRDWTGVIIG